MVAADTTRRRSVAPRFGVVCVHQTLAERHRGSPKPTCPKENARPQGRPPRTCPPQVAHTPALRSRPLLAGLSTARWFQRSMPCDACRRLALPLPLAFAGSFCVGVGVTFGLDKRATVRQTERWWRWRPLHRPRWRAFAGRRLRNGPRRDRHRLEDALSWRCGRRWHACQAEPRWRPATLTHTACEAGGLPPVAPKRGA